MKVRLPGPQRPSIVTETIPDHDDGDPMRDDTDDVYWHRVVCIEVN